MLRREGRGSPHRRPVMGIYPVTESIVLPPVARDCVMGTFFRSRCPICKTQTKLALITPGSSGFMIRTFQCPTCKEIQQRVAALPDPMKSREMAGWIRSELRTPT